MNETITILVEKTKTGYSAYAQGHGVLTVGATLREVHEKIVEALNLHYEPETIKAEQLSFRYDLGSLFEAYPALSAKALAERIGLNVSLLSQYVSGTKKPAKKQLDRILEGVHAIGRDLQQAQLWRAE